MANFLTKLPINELPIDELTNTANSALTEAANNTTKQLPELNSALETANSALETASSIKNAATKVKETIQDKPTLEDSVREALLKVIVNPKFSEQIESDIATVFRPILKMQLEKVGKIIANADEAKTPEEAEAVKAKIKKAIAEELVPNEAEEVVTKGSDTEGSVTKGSDTEGSVTKKLVSPEDIKLVGGLKRNRNKSRKSLKKSASRGRRTTRRHKRTSR
jgi:hypothetical protein